MDALTAVVEGSGLALLFGIGLSLTRIARALEFDNRKRWP